MNECRKEWMNEWRNDWMNSGVTGCFHVVCRRLSCHGKWIDRYQHWRWCFGIEHCCCYCCCCWNYLRFGRVRRIEKVAMVCSCCCWCCCFCCCRICEEELAPSNGEFWRVAYFGEFAQRNVVMCAWYCNRVAGWTWKKNAKIVHGIFAKEPYNSIS